MFSLFFKNKKWALWAYGGLTFIVISVIVQTNLSVAINEWQRAFYDTVQNVNNHSTEEFINLLYKFLFISLSYVVIYTVTNFVASHWVFRWREAMTFGYIDFWKQCKQDIEGSSQRIQEDMYRFAKIIERLSLEVLGSVMTIIAFVPLLWRLSDGVDVPILRDIPGSLVWVAILVSVGGLIISWFVGIKLPHLEYDIQKTEAAFRKELVYAEDDKIHYASNQSIVELFCGIRFCYYRIFLHYGYFNFWLISFAQLMDILPYLVMGNGLFTGLITLGAMVQTSGAFGNVRSSFSIFINNWPTITELRSIHKRLSEFEKNIGFK